MRKFLCKLLALRQREGAQIPVRLVCTHPQGGNCLGTVVDTETFAVNGIGNLFVADDSIFPAGCEINPQLTLKALATLAYDKVDNFLQSEITENVGSV